MSDLSTVRSPLPACPPSVTMSDYHLKNYQQATAAFSFYFQTHVREDTVHVLVARLMARHFNGRSPLCLVVLSPSPLHQLNKVWLKTIFTIKHIKSCRCDTVQQCGTVETKPHRLHTSQASQDRKSNTSSQDSPLTLRINVIGTTAASLRSAFLPSPEPGSDLISDHLSTSQQHKQTALLCSSVGL